MPETMQPLSDAVGEHLTRIILAVRAAEFGAAVGDRVTIRRAYRAIIDEAFRAECELS